MSVLEKSPLAVFAALLSYVAWSGNLPGATTAPERIVRETGTVAIDSHAVG